MTQPDTNLVTLNLRRIIFEAICQNKSENIANANVADRAAIRVIEAIKPYVRSPEREVVEEWQPPTDWHHYGMAIVRSKLLEDHVYLQGKNGDVWRVWLEMDGKPSIECVKYNAPLPKRNDIEGEKP